MSFEFKKLNIPGLLTVNPKKIEDERGFFMEKYKRSDFETVLIPEFVQDNFSYSKFGVVRGLHYQLPPYSQGKLVSVIKGEVFDVAVDLRKSSPFFGKWEGVTLSGENNMSFYIPPGFAHGFVVLSNEAFLSYKCTEEYNPSSERGIVWNDNNLNIDWKIRDPIISPKDRSWPSLREAQIFE